MSIAFPGSTYPTLSTYGLIAAGNIDTTGGAVRVNNGYWGYIGGNIIGPGVLPGASPSGLNNTDINQAVTDSVALSLAINGLTYQDIVLPSLSGQSVTYYPGAYSAVKIAFPINTTVNLDAQGDPNAQFIFRGTGGNSSVDAGIDLTFAVAIRLKGGAKASNVFWYSRAGPIVCNPMITLADLPGTIVSLSDFPPSISNVIQVQGSVFSVGSGVVISGVDIYTTGNPAPCYFKGTQILTDNGCVAVETLKVGDKVQTFADVDSEFKVTVREPTLQSVVSAETFTVEDPTLANGLICLSTGCLGKGLPVHNLYVSPDHGILVNGYLVPAKTLVNGASIFHERTVQKLDYYHVEMESHVCIEANGALAESFKRA